MLTHKAVRNLMDTVDAHAQQMGSGPYCDLSKKMRQLHDAVKHDDGEAKREFATQLLVELTACAGAASVAGFTHEKHFMLNLVKRKAAELQAHEPHVAPVLGLAWKIELVEALTPHENALTLVNVRIGIQKLLLARVEFFSQIVHRLAILGISPQVLCPFDFGQDPKMGDEGRGPTAREFLFHEPRFSRWLLGNGERVAVSASRLVPFGAPEDEEVCIPTTNAFDESLTPSECSSDTDDEIVS